jgi:hypothetical protein
MSKSKWSVYDAEINELIQSIDSNSKVAKKILKNSTKEDIDLFRTYIKRYKQRLDFKEDTETFTNHYEPTKQVFSAINANGGIMNLETYCKHYGLDFDKVRSFKLVSHTGTPFYNIAFYESVETNENVIDFTNIFKELVKPLIVKPSLSPKLKGCLFDRAVYTDVHVAMEVNQNGYSLYDGIWDEEEINNRLLRFIDEILSNQKSNVLLLHDLGDLMDGYDGYTTRGGHKLPQNMDNQKAFDVALKFKILMIDRLFKFYDEIKVVNICNDNHGGSFTYVVNSAFKTFVEMKYPNNINVVNQRKFIDHYIIGNRCFILTHGKDDKSLKFGFKPQLDPAQVEKIKNYIDEYKLHQYKIEFSKGDSHQLLFDFTTSTAFEYQNFGAFSPPSDWVKTNFKNTSSSFVTFNYYENQKTINPYIF